MSRACALAFALALVGCREPNKPSVLVTVRYTEGQFTFTALRVVVRAGSTTLEETTVRSKPDGGALGPGETLRVFVAKAYAGARVNVLVEALDTAGAVVAKQEVDSGVLALDQDAEAIVVLAPVTMPDACPPGAPPTGCCNLETSTRNGPQRAERRLDAGFPACAPVGKVCVACDLVSSDRCDEGKCQCGVGPPCGPGVACVMGACLCPRQCPGCCDASGACRNPPTAALCGAGGNSCDMCSGGAGCTTAGTCSNFGCNCLLPQQCCSGSGCLAVGSFPRCKDPKNRACVVCDFARSDGCGGFMAATVACSCGLGPPCADNELCVNRACVPLVR